MNDKLNNDLENEKETIYDDFANIEEPSNGCVVIDNDSIFIVQPQKKRSNGWLLFTIFFGVYIIISIFLSNIVLEPLQVIGSSMYPTLNGGDVNETTCDVVYTLNKNSYSRKDIVIFNSKSYTGEDSLYIKRVIGVAGDRIYFKRIDSSPIWTDENGYTCSEYQLYVNDVLQEESYINQETNTIGTMYLRAYIPTANTIYANTINNGKTSEVSVPVGQVYVLGDNRRVSNDSKYYGCVYISDCIGKVIYHIEYGETKLSAVYRAIQKNYLE